MCCVKGIEITSYLKGLLTYCQSKGGKVKSGTKSLIHIITQLFDTNKLFLYFYFIVFGLLFI